MFSINPVELIAGDLPRVQRRLVEAWVDLHRLNSTLTGSAFRRAVQPCRLPRYNSDMTAHSIHRVTSFERIGAHALRVELANGSRQTIDFTPVLAGELYGPLQDPEVFAQVRLDYEVHTLVWPNGADFDPATLHDCPLVAEELAARACVWGSIATHG